MQNGSRPQHHMLTFRKGLPGMLSHYFSFNISLDLHARDCRQEVPVHRELLFRSRHRGAGPVDLHEGEQQ